MQTRLLSGANLLALRRFESKFAKFLTLILTFVISWLSFSVIQTIVYALDKGVDWTDESWVLEMSRGMHRQIDQVWGYQYFTNLLLTITNSNLYYLRFVRLFLYLITNFVLAWSIVQFFLSQRIGKVHSIFLALSLSFLSTAYAFTWQPRYVSYNELTVWLTSILLSIFLINRDSARSVHLSEWIRALLVGSTISILFISKFPAALLLFTLLLLLFILKVPPFSLWHSRRSTVFFFVGLTAPLIYVHYVSNQALFYLQSVVATLKSEGEIATVLRIYASELLYVIKFMSPRFFLPLIVFLIVSNYLFAKEKWHSRFLEYLVLPVSYFALVWNCRIVPSDSFPSIGRMFISLLLLNALWLIWFLKRGSLSHKDFLLLLLLNFIPFIESFGTHNKIGGQTAFGNVAIFCVSAVIISLFCGCNFSKIICLLLIFVFFFTLSPTVTHTNSKGLYRIAPVESLTAKSEKIFLLRQIYLTPTEAKNYDWLKGELDKLPTKYKVIPLGNPGFNFAFKGTGFSSPWLDSFWPESFSTLKHSCQKRGSQITHLAVIVKGTVSVENEALLNGAIKDCGVYFPETFYLSSRTIDQEFSIFLTDIE